MEDGYDFVRVYDGNSVEAQLSAELTGTELTTSIFTSSGSAITIQMQSDGSEQRIGFSLEYSAEAFAANDHPCVTGLNIDAASPGTISSPGYSEGRDYDNNSDCAWIITFETG